MNFIYKDEIINLQAFHSTFDEIKLIDPKMEDNIKRALEASLNESHKLILEANSNGKLELALIKEQIAIQAQNSQYLNITDEITQKKNTLLEHIPKIYREFMQEVEIKISKLFHDQKLKMFKEIEKDASWYSGLRDSAKKSGGILVNATLKGINTVTKEFKGKSFFEKEDLLDSNTIVESLLEKYLNSQVISKHVSEILSSSLENFENKWIKQINLNVPNIERLSAFSIASSAKSNLRVNFQLGASEQVLAVGFGSAVVGAVGLAMGWHTLTYAMLNVFPPIAFFAAVATVVVGVLTKERSVIKRKKDIEDAVNQYHQYFLLQLYSLKLTSLGDKSISMYIEQLGQKIVEETVLQWEKTYFGDLKIEHFRKLNQAFVKHLMHVNEALEELDKQKS